MRRRSGTHQEEEVARARPATDGRQARGDIHQATGDVGYKPPVEGQPGHPEEGVVGDGARQPPRPNGLRLAGRRASHPTAASGGGATDGRDAGGRECVYMCMRICVYVCMCVCVYIYIYIHIHTYGYIYIYIHTCMHTCSMAAPKCEKPPDAIAPTHPSAIALEPEWLRIYVYVYVYIYIYIHIYIYIYTCTCIYIYIEKERELYIYIYKFIHTHMLSQESRRLAAGRAREARGWRNTVEMVLLEICVYILYIYIYIYTYICIYTSIHSSICVYIYTYIYIYISVAILAQAILAQVGACLAEPLVR